MLYGSKEKRRLFGELSSSCCFPLSCSVSTRPRAFMQEIIVVLSMELLALEKENLFFMKWCCLLCAGTLHNWKNQMPVFSAPLDRAVWTDDRFPAQVSWKPKKTLHELCYFERVVRIGLMVLFILSMMAKCTLCALSGYSVKNCESS